MVITKYFNPQNDFAFKRIFGQEKNKKILIAMLNAVLKESFHGPIEDVQFLKTIQDPEIGSQKQSIVDVLCKDQDGCQYIIEMQVASRQGFEKRAQYYAAKAYVNQAGVGRLYQNLKKVIFLAFTNYILFPKEKKHKTEHITLEKNSLNHHLTALRFVFVELPKFLAICPEDISTLSLEEKFYYFLAKAEEINRETLEKLAGKDIIIQKAFDELEGVNWTQEELNTYNAAQKRELDHEACLADAMDKGMKKGKKEGLAEGMEKGIEKGKEEERKAMAAKMRKAGVDPALIAQILQEHDDE